MVIGTERIFKGGGNKERTKTNKHFAELSDVNIEECTEPDYLASILADLSD